MSPQLTHSLAYTTVVDPSLRKRRATQHDSAILATLGGSGPIYCSADHSDDGMAGFSRSELLTTTEVEKSIAAAANRGTDQAHHGKNNADSVEESGDEKILTDDAHGFSRQFKKFRNLADVAVHQNDRGARRCQIRNSRPSTCRDQPWPEPARRSCRRQP